MRKKEGSLARRLKSAYNLAVESAVQHSSRRLFPLRVAEDADSGANAVVLAIAIGGAALLVLIGIGVAWHRLLCRRRSGQGAGHGSTRTVEVNDAATLAAGRGPGRSV